MELTWPIKLRIAIVSAVGIGLIGIIAWPLVAPADPFGVVSVVNGKINAAGAIVLLALAFVIGLVSYFLSWPYGSQLGVLAVPAGLAVWAARSGDIGTLMQLNTPIIRREQIFSTLRWEPMLWLAVVMAGLLGVFIASRIIRPAGTTPEPADPCLRLAGAGKPAKKSAGKPSNHSIGNLVSAIVAIIGSAVVAQLFIGLFARDSTVTDATAVTAVAQPATAQIVFAVIVAFTLAGFLVKKVLDFDYILPIISSCLVTPFAVIAYGKHDVLEYFARHWPAVFFPNTVLAALPIQIVAFGTIGATIGCWLAVRYDYWYQHEISGG
ncbi:MAG: hypothetical protein ABSG82_03210 [Sedimentisphaerales bacterium]|jgi:hypothetical protein